jgi:hypothetical protein
VAREAAILNLDQPAGLAAVEAMVGAAGPRSSEHS